MVRQSTDKGAIFGSVITLSPASTYPSFQPVITYRAGAFRAIFERCTSDTCSASNTYYRSSTTGTTWATTYTASVHHRTYESPADVDVATRIFVLYDDSSSGGNNVEIRRGS